MKKVARLTDLEIKIMRVLWESGQSLTIQEIASRLEKEGLSVASVSQAIKHLIAKKAVMVNEHVLVSNVYARTFSACFSQDEYMTEEIQRLQKTLFFQKKPNMVGIITTLLQNSDDSMLEMNQIKELQKIIDDKKNELERE